MGVHSDACDECGLDIADVWSAGSSLYRPGKVAPTRFLILSGNLGRPCWDINPMNTEPTGSAELIGLAPTVCAVIFSCLNLP